MVFLHHIHKSRFVWSIIDLVQLLSRLDDKLQCYSGKYERVGEKTFVYGDIVPVNFNKRHKKNETLMVTEQWVSIE